jgi:hypothetical protein
MGWNRSSELMFDRSASEMIGEQVIRVISADRLAEESVIFAQIRQGERIDHFESERRRKDGVEFPVSLIVSPTRGPDGDITGKVCQRPVSIQTILGSVKFSMAASRCSRPKPESRSRLGSVVRTDLGAISN